MTGRHRRAGAASLQIVWQQVEMGEIFIGKQMNSNSVNQLH